MFGFSRPLFGSLLAHGCVVACLGLAMSKGSARRDLAISLELTRENDQADPDTLLDVASPAEEPPGGIEALPDLVEETAASEDALAEASLSALLASSSQVAQAPRPENPDPVSDNLQLAEALLETIKPAAPVRVPIAAPQPSSSAQIATLEGRNPPPPYPPIARKRGWTGRVVLAVEVAVDGSVVTIRVLHSSNHTVLDQAALETVKAWRFTAGPGTTEVAIRFVLDGNS